MTTEKQDLRVKINNETHQLLDAYCEQSGTTKGQVITDLIWVSILPRLAHARHILSNMYINNIYSTPDISEVKTKTRGKHLLPADFCPSRSIAEDAGIDYDGALEAFTDWAKASGKRYLDWDACFRGACKTWLKERFPHLRKITSSQTTKGLRFD
tara:strand:+ start:246 stop:710 length:465 start_codon:yes stop_codon:yes gene_type:complete